MRVFSAGFGRRSTPGPKLGRWRGPGAGGPGYPGIQNTDIAHIILSTTISLHGSSFTCFLADEQMFKLGGVDTWKSYHHIWLF
jgi:hypothetical protein